jgi:hypothetical protein
VIHVDTRQLFLGPWQPIVEIATIDQLFVQSDFANGFTCERSRGHCAVLKGLMRPKAKWGRSDA